MSAGRPRPNQWRRGARHGASGRAQPGQGGPMRTGPLANLTRLATLGCLTRLAILAAVCSAAAYFLPAPFSWPLGTITVLSLVLYTELGLIYFANLFKAWWRS